MDRIGGEREPGDRRAIGVETIIGMPTLGPPGLAGFLGDLQFQQRWQLAAATTGAQRQLGEALQLGQG